MMKKKLPEEIAGEFQYQNLESEALWYIVLGHRIVISCFLGKPMTPIEKQLMIFLWFASTKDCTVRQADRFGCAQSTLIRCISKVMNAINRQLLPKVHIFYLIFSLP